MKFAITLALLALSAHADVPDWVRTAAQKSVPESAANAKAVVLFDGEDVAIDGNAITTHRRRVAKILTAGGLDLARVTVFLDVDSKLRNFHGWTITPRGETEASIPVAKSRRRGPAPSSGTMLVRGCSF